MNISTVINGNVHLEVNLGSLEANAAQNQIRREIIELESPTSQPHEKVLLYWHQAKSDPKSNTGDRGIIESISKTPVKVIFDSEQLKVDILLNDENPLKSAYIVDAVVETINGRPALYKITHLHERFDKPENEPNNEKEA